MAEELKFHEQDEGWQHEWLSDRQCVCIMRPREIGGGFVTVDFERRIFGSGYGKPGQGATASTYTGNGWKNRIVRDAVDHLERIMSETEPMTSQPSRPEKCAMTPIEQTLLQRLASQGPIRGTAQVGYMLWPDRSMQPQGAALAAGKILRALRNAGYVDSHYESKLSRYEITDQGRAALAEQAA